MSKRKVLSKSYEVEEIVARKVVDGKVHYQVKWIGYPSEDNTWEPKEHLENVIQMVEEFEKQYGKKAKKSEKPEKEKEREKSVEKSKEKQKDLSKNKKKSTTHSSSHQSESESVSHTISLEGEPKIVGIRKCPKDKSTIEFQVDVSKQQIWMK